MTKAGKIIFYVLSCVPLLWVLTLCIFLFYSRNDAIDKDDFSKQHILEDTFLFYLAIIVLTSILGWLIFLIVIKVKKYKNIKLLPPFVIFALGIFLIYYMLKYNPHDWQRFID